MYMKKLLLVGMCFVFVGAGCTSAPQPTVVTPDTTPTTTQNAISDVPVVISLKPFDVIKSPLHIQGEAPGGWYFEATFPVRIVDANGTVLGAVPAHARGDWMTTSSVPFEADMTFVSPTTSDGFLVLEKDNPSGLPQYDKELRVPVRFETRSISILFSNVLATTYCDGNTMDSIGYRKTITTPKTMMLPRANMTQTDIAKFVATTATSGQCSEALRQSTFRVKGDTVYISAMDGWAGISIALCSCKPQVEVNLLRIPGIKNVMWDDPAKQ